jgi:quercetin dioxygenase-like cupin family protein
MNQLPYIVYPGIRPPALAKEIGPVLSQIYINEPGQISFSTIDYIPGWHIAPHRHDIWELIIIDKSSPQAGFVFLDGRWWRAEPGSAVFVPRNYPHAWSSSNDGGFKMLGVYGGSIEEAGRRYDVDPKKFLGITREEERQAALWPAA